MEISDIALRFVGAFYAFAGVVATRAAIMSAFLDMAIAKISLKRTETRETLRTWWLLVTSGIIFLGGLALAVQLEVAQWLFVVSAIGQAVYLSALAPYYFDIDDPPDAKGRAQTLNAFVLYLAATAFVLWGALHNKLKPLEQTGAAATAVGATVLAAYLWYVASTAWKTFRPATGDASTPDEFGEDDMVAEPAPFDGSRVHRVKVMADYGCDPLWSLDDHYWNFSGAAIGLSAELTEALSAWALRYDQSLNVDDPANSHWTDADFAAHRADGRALAERLKTERPELMVFAWEPEVGVVEVSGDR